MRSIFVVLISALSVLSAVAQGNVMVSGNVITTDGKQAEFITVSLKNSSYGGTSDADGRFQFSAKAGKYTMVVQSLSAHSSEMPVTIEEGKENVFENIKIKESANQLDEVVVTGQFAPQSLKKSLYKVRTINSKTIEMKAPATVEALLNTELGIRISNDMALGESDFELMGMSGNNVKVLLDGVALLDRGAKKQSLSQLDVNTIERIEIVEGPMSVIYGTDALAGVINIITKKGKGFSEHHTWEVGARIQEESNGKEYNFFHKDGNHNESVDLGLSLRNGFFVKANASRNATGGWTGDKTGREKRWHPKDQWLIGGMAGYRRHNLNVWYRLNYTDETIYTPINANANVPTQIKDKDFLTDRFNHQLQADWNLGTKLTLNLVSSYQDYKRRSRTMFTDLETGEKWPSKESGGQDVTKYNSFNIRATATWNINSKISLQPGIEYQRTQGMGDRVSNNEGIYDLAFFVSAEYKPTDWLSLRPGARIFIVTSYKNPIAVPSILTKFNLNQKMDLRLSYAYGFRTPTVQELYMDFVHGGTHIMGNPDVKAEYSHNVTAAYNYRILHTDKIRLNTTLSGFFNMYKDKIAIAPHISDPGIHTHYNIDDYKTAGGTLEASLSWENLTANVNFAYVGRYNRYSDEVNAKSQFRFYPEVGANIGYTIAKSGTSFNLYYKFSGQRAEYFMGTDNDNNDVIYLKTVPSYNTGDFTVTQRVTSFLKVNAGVKNIFNLTSKQVLYDRTDVGNMPTMYLGCGVSWFVGLTFNMDGKF